ncbi:MAG TPA: hypothetical protein DHW82_12060 [Spirochaetia bacterium]|nr:hypothetical protein [Spirochaetia bacterium]
MNSKETFLKEILKDFESNLQELFQENMNFNFDQIESKVLKIRDNFGQKLTESVLKHQNEKTKKKTVKNAGKS